MLGDRKEETTYWPAQEFTQTKINLSVIQSLNTWEGKRWYHRKSMASSTIGILLCLCYYNTLADTG